MSTTLATQAAKAITASALLHSAYPEIASHTLVTDRTDPALWPGVDGLPRTQVVDEEDVYPRQAWTTRFGAFERLSPGRGSWYYQQLLKLAWLLRTAARLATAPRPERIGLLIWDADTHILRAIPLRGRETQPSYAYCSGNPHDRHQPFYEVNAALTGVSAPDHQPRSNIVQFAALSVEETLGFAAFLKLDPHAEVVADLLSRRISEAILAVGAENSALFSEYELIGLYQRRRNAPTRRIRFIRVNRKTASAAQLRLMRRVGTSEEWHGAQQSLSYPYLFALLLLQLCPAAQYLRPLLGRAR